MNETTGNRRIKVLGIDLGKDVFHLHGVDEKGRTVLRRKMIRSKLAAFMVNLPPCLVGLEACGGSHYWARKFRGFGHEARLMSPQFVKPYVKSNKNDAADAEAICEAVGRPGMRFVPIKSEAQQDMQSLHRTRSLALSQRTAMTNQIRGLLLEYGIAIPRGSSHLRKRLPGILEDAENGLSFEFRELLASLRDALKVWDRRLTECDAWIVAAAKNDEACVRLMAMPGIGPVIATSLAATVGDANVFRRGREMSAWLGLVPRQHSTGGKARLLGISKRGDAYLRTQLIHGARSALLAARKRQDGRSRWVRRLAERSNANVAAVALANKMVRMAWVILAKGESYTEPAGI